MLNTTSNSSSSFTKTPSPLVFRSNSQLFKLFLSNKEYLVYLLLLFAFSCNTNTDDLAERKSHSDKIKRFEERGDRDYSLKDLLEASLLYDTVECTDISPFVYFQSGKLSMVNQKVAIWIGSQDSTYSLKLFTLKDSTWNLADSLNSLDDFPIQFFPVFDDFNFDGQKDVYIQVTASNGYVMSRGHLILIDPLTKKMHVHPEARYLANMKSDPSTRTVISDSLVTCKLKSHLEVCKVNSAWVKEELKIMNVDCPCAVEGDAKK